MSNFTSAAQLLRLCEESGRNIGEVMLKRETYYLEQPPEETDRKIRRVWEIMESSVKTALEAPQKTMGGLIGGEAIKLRNYQQTGRSLCGSVTSKAIAYAMGVLEVNASMGLIVAAPTAGSSGVLPGVLTALKETYDFSVEEILGALYNASAVGYLISRNATVAGAEGGCQAEVGAASAMAASAAVQLMGGTPEQCLYAASTAICNLLGLVCDPIGGLVESPCQGRNAIGAANALLSAEIALAGAAPALPLDEVIDAMYKVGRSLPSELRETAMGGIAACPSARSRCASCGKCGD